MSETRSARLLLLSPHPGDAAFSVGLTLHLWARQGLPLRVMTCFSRSGYAPGLAAGASVDAVTRLRRSEDRAFLAAIGSAAEGVDLGRSDALQRPGHAPGDDFLRGRSFSPADHREIRALRRQVARRLAPGDAVLAPLAVGTHIDHRLVREVACGMPPATPLGFYEDLPYASGVPNADLCAAADDAARECGRALRPIVVRQPKLMACKLDYVLSYASQVDPTVLSAIAGHGDRYWRGERLWVDDDMAALLAGTISDHLVADAPHESSFEDLLGLYRSLRDASADELEARIEPLDDPEQQDHLRRLGRAARTGREREFIALYIALELGEEP